jgi:hypothetical protein
VARDLPSYWSDSFPRFRRSRALIDECGRWARQEVKPRVSRRKVDGQVAQQGFPVVLPHSTTMGQDVAAFVARRQPSFHRKPLGGGTRAERTASKVEQWLQEAFASKVFVEGEPLWDAITSFAANDGEFAVLIQPASSAYSGFLDFRDEDGTISATWRRNRAGQDLDEYATDTGSSRGYRTSEGKSSDAYQRYLHDYKARRWPFVVRVLSAAEYLPLGRNPLSGRLDTLLIRSVCSATHLQSQGFQFWPHADGGAQASNVEGPGQSYWLYELHLGNPWRIIYQIVGLDGVQYDATKDGQPAQLGLDLGQQYGLQQVPAGVFYGWHRPQEKDPDKRGIPLLAPFLGVIGGAQTSITGIVEHLYRTGFGGWGVEMDKDLYQVWIEMGRPTQFDLLDDSIHVLLGRPTSLVHQGAGADAWRVLEFLFGLVERFNEGERARSSPDASSIAQTTALASVDTILGQINTGSLQAMKLVAECLLEQCAALSDEMGAPIPVYCTLNKDGKEQTHVELSADDLLGDFTVDVEQPTRKGANLPKAQAGVSWVDKQLVSRYEWREEFLGDPQPEHELDRIAAEQYINGPEGQQQLGLIVSRMLGDLDAQQIRGLQDQGKLTPGGTPSAMMPPRPGQPSQSGVGQDGVPTASYPNQAASALGGMTAAAVNPGAITNVVRATGQGPEMAPP